MSICNEPQFLSALRKAPSKRSRPDVELIHSRLREIESLRSRSESELQQLSGKARYEYYPANSILFRQGESFNSWFVLLSGSVFISGSMYQPPATFGQQSPGVTKRINQCYTLEASELLVVDYDQIGKRSQVGSSPGRIRAPAATRGSVASNESISHSDYYSSNINFDNDNGDSDGEENSLPSSLRSSCPSLLIKDQALDALEKSKDERSEHEIDMLHEFLQVLPAFNNLTGPIRRELCRHMVYVSVEIAGTTVLGHNEELDSWVVLLSGQVELRQVNGQVTKIDVGESFGVTSSLEKQYHVGELVTLAPDAQFVCIEQAQYYDVLHQGEENRINVLDPKTGEVSLVQEKRIDGLVAIRGTPKALLTNLLEHESKADKYFIEDFLLTSRTFLPAMSQIGDILLQWFEQKSYREKVTRVVSMWVNEHFCDFDSNRELLHFLERFERRLEEENMPQQRDLLHLVCESRPRDRTIQIKRKSTEAELFFEVTGGVEKGYPLYISQVDPGSPADAAGLKRGDLLLSMNQQNFENMTYDIAMTTLKRHTDMVFTVRTNLFGFKKMLADLKGSKNGPRILTPTKEQKTKKSQKIFTQLFGSSRKTGKMDKVILPNHPKMMINTVKQDKNPSHDSSSNENEGDGFQDLPDVEAIKVFRSDQSYKYISITKETTAREAVRLALLEFGFTEEESQSAGRFSLCRVSCLDNHFIKQTRLPDPLSDLSSKLNLSDRYYLKDLTETAPLVPDLLAPELVRDSHISFLDLSTFELANQLTVRDYKMFRNVLPTDYVTDIFHRSGGPKDHSEIKAMETLENLVNDEMFWAIHEVCQETNVHRRAKVIKHFIHIVLHLKMLKNYNSMFAIISGLGHGAVSRLKQSWEKLTPKTNRQFIELQALMDPSRNMSKYRSMKQDNDMPPLIPFVPVIKKDLTFLHLGNDTKVEGLINFEKMRMIATEIRTVRQYCEPIAFSSPYCPKADPITMPTSTLGRRTAKRGHINPERLYKEAAAARKVKQYLDMHWNKIIKDEENLMSLSKSVEPPPAPLSTPTSRKTVQDNLSIHSSPGITVKHGNKHTLKTHHIRTGSEPTMATPLMPMVSMTKGNNRTMVPVADLPKFGVENSNNLNKLLSLAESGHNNLSRYGERRRYKSGQSDSSINTTSTSYTQHSAPIITNPRPAGSRPRNKPRPLGLPTSPSLDFTPREKPAQGRRNQRPLSEQFNQSLSLTKMTQPQNDRRRQRSVDQSREQKVESSLSMKSERKSNRHRSTPDLLQAPINPIYQARDLELSSTTFVTKI